MLKIGNGGCEIRVSRSPKESQGLEAQILSKSARSGVGAIKGGLKISCSSPEFPAIVRISVERILSLSVALGIVHFSVNATVPALPERGCCLFDSDDF